MNPTQAATQAIQGLGPSQAPTAAPVNTAMAPGLTPQGAVAAPSTAAPAPDQFSAALNNMYAAQNQATVGAKMTGAAIGKNANDVSNAYSEWQKQHSQDILNASNAQNASNPSNFKRAPSQNGGYNFTFLRLRVFFLAMAS